MHDLSRDGERARRDTESPAGLCGLPREEIVDINANSDVHVESNIDSNCDVHVEPNNDSNCDVQVEPNNDSSADGDSPNALSLSQSRSHDNTISDTIGIVTQ